jgi:peptidoglycan hydrolase-like protein with peptidoglycan-binding domain
MPSNTEPIVEARLRVLEALMTPRQARVALVMFMAIASGVAYNALYLQDGTAPGRRIASDALRPDVPSAGATRVGQATARSGKTTDTPKGAARDAGVETVRAIQRELNQRGYGPVVDDGLVRPVTRAAIISFEQDNRLPLTGAATDALLARLMLGSSAKQPESVAAAGQVQSPQAEETIRHMQRLLAANGYRPGPADGRLGSDTVEAIRAFEKDQGLPAKGRVSAEVLARLQTSASKLKAAEAH